MGKTDKKLVSWNEIPKGGCFTWGEPGAGGMGCKISKNRLFSFNSYSEIKIDRPENRDNKVFKMASNDEHREIEKARKALQKESKKQKS